MTKGAASVVLLLTLIVVAAVERWGRRQFDRTFFAGLALFIAAVVPWHVMMWSRFGRAFTNQYLGVHVLARASSQIEGHHTHAWYYVLVLLVSAPPWVVLYPFAVVAVFRDPGLRGLRVLSLFALVVLLFFTAVQTRLPHYIAPAYPALSAIAGVLLVRWLRMAAERWTTSGARLAGLSAIAFVWVCTIAMTARPRKDLHSPRMSNGMVTPDTHEPAALLKQAMRSPGPEKGPLLLLASPPIAPITTALFYARRPVQQVYFGGTEPQPATDPYTWEPAPLAEQTSAEPRLILLERTALLQLPPQLSFTPTASSTHWELGTIVRQDVQP